MSLANKLRHNTELTSFLVLTSKAGALGSRISASPKKGNFV